MEPPGIPERFREFHQIGGQARGCIAALDVMTGAATAWDPNAHGRVNKLSVSGLTVYAGGGFTWMGGLPQSGIAGMSSYASSVPTGGDPIPEDFQVMPNPVHGQVTVAFNLEAATAVALEIYDASGRRVWSYPPTMLDAGRQTLRWDGRRDSDRAARSGVYFLRLHGAGIDLTKRVALLK